MDTKLNLSNNRSDIFCVKGSVAENKILKMKLEDADGENIFVPGAVEDKWRPPWCSSR